MHESVVHTMIELLFIHESVYQWVISWTLLIRTPSLSWTIIKGKQVSSPWKLFHKLWKKSFQFKNDKIAKTSVGISRSIVCGSVQLVSYWQAGSQQPGFSFHFSKQAVSHGVAKCQIFSQIKIAVQNFTRKTGTSRLICLCDIMRKSWFFCA